MHRTKETLGRAWQERMSADSNRESHKSCSALREELISLILSLNTSSQNDGGPTGEPRREKPLQVFGISGGSGNVEAPAFFRYPPVKLEMDQGIILLNDMQSSNQVFWLTHECAVIQVPAGFHLQGGGAQGKLPPQIPPQIIF